MTLPAGCRTRPRRRVRRCGGCLFGTTTRSRSRALSLRSRTRVGSPPVPSPLPSSCRNSLRKRPGRTWISRLCPRRIARGAWQTRGATGQPVRTLVRLVEDMLRDGLTAAGFPPRIQVRGMLSRERQSELQEERCHSPGRTSLRGNYLVTGATGTHGQNRRPKAP